MEQDINSRVTIRGVEYRIDGFGSWGEGKFFGKHSIYLVRISDGAKFKAYGARLGHNSKVEPGHGIRHLEEGR